MSVRFNGIVTVSHRSGKTWKTEMGQGKSWKSPGTLKIGEVGELCNKIYIFLILARFPHKIVVKVSATYYSILFH